MRTVVKRRPSGPLGGRNFSDRSGFQEVCGAAYGLDLAALKYLLWEVGVPASVESDHTKRLTPMHCLADVYTMSEASSKSLLFSMLKGQESWLSPLVSGVMPTHASSIRSMDIVETLGPMTVEVCCRIDCTDHLRLITIYFFCSRWPSGCWPRART